MSSSDESDAGPQHKRKRKTRPIRGSPSSTSSGSPIIANSSSSRRQRIRSTRPLADSDDSGSPILHRHRKKIVRVSSSSDSDSSDEAVTRRLTGPRRLESDSENESDWGLGGSTSSQWESDFSNTGHEQPVEPETSGARPAQETNIDSDFSDGQSEKCPICLVSFKTQEIGSPESCDHTFCLECIQEWSKNMNTCPIDRQKYNLILVRQTLNGKVTRQVPISAPSLQAELDIVEDPTFCEICGSYENEDRMLLCDGCDLGFHLYCLTPPLEEVPTGQWFCNECLNDSNGGYYEVYLHFGSPPRIERVDRPDGRPSSTRLIPRTRQSERVRRRIQSIRQQNASLDTVERQSLQTTELSVTVTSSTSTRRSKKKRKKSRRKRSTRKTQVRIVYEIDEVTGETVAVEKRSRKSTRRRKARNNRSREGRPTIKPKTVKKRLAQQLGICAPRSVPQNLPDVKVPNTPNTIGGMRYQAGIPTLHLFGQNNDLDYFSGDEEDYSPGSQLLARRAPNQSDVSAMRRTMRRKTMVTLPETVSSSTDLLDSILSSQEQFHSRNASFSVDSSGRFKIENTSKNYVDVTKERASAKEAPYYNNNRNYNNSNRWYNNRNQNNRYNNRQSNYYSNNQNSNYYSEPSSSMGYSGNRPRGEENNYPQDYTQRTLCASSDIDNQYQEPEERDENAAGTSKPNSESELDIYSDIETVSTSKADESYMRPPSPPIISNTSNTPNTCTDDDNNDSEPDMVIDDEKVQEQETVVDKREETAVTSTVDYSNDVEPPAEFYDPNSYSTEIQSGAVQSSNLDYIKNYGYDEEEDDTDDGCPNSNIYSKEAMESNAVEEDVDSDDGCPNFSIYSKESKSVAMRTEISLPVGSAEQDNQVGEISSSPNVAEVSVKQNEDQQQGSASYEPECTYDPENIYEQDDEGEEKSDQVDKPEERVEEETYDPAKCFDEEESNDGNKSYDPEQTYDPEKIYEDNSNSVKVGDDENSNAGKEYDPEKCYDPEKEISDDNSQATDDVNTAGNRYDPSVPFDGDINDDHHESDNDSVVRKSAEQYQEAVEAFNKEYRKSDVTSETNNDNLEEGELEKSNADDEVLQTTLRKPKIKGGITGGLYSDSEDENVVRKDDSKFAMSDINDMTEDISEEERSYTPCLDEKSHRAGLEGLDTELISDEDRNDFDESHELKTVSDGDALEINAKESELDFTRPEDYEEGEIVDKNKEKTLEEEPEPEIEAEAETEAPKKKEEGVKEAKKPKKKDKEKSATDKDKDKDKSGNKENIGVNKEQAFKKLSKNNKERNYRKDDKDKEKRQTSPRRSRSREPNKKEKRRDKRKEIERYNVRALIAEKPRPLIAKDQFGRDIRDTPPRSRSRSYTPPIQRSLSRDRSVSRTRRSVSRRRKSVSKEREKSRKRRPRSRTQRHASKSRSRSPLKKRSGSKSKKRKRSSSRYRKRKTGDRSRAKKRQRTGSRHRSRTPSAIRRQRDWETLDWTPMSQGMEQPHNMSPSWTPPRAMDNSQVLRNEHLTVTLNNTGKKKKDKRRKSDKRSKNTLESRQKKRRHDRDRTPPPSKEVFASGDNILVSVSFNNENETRDITTRDKRRSDEASKKKREKKKNRRDLSGVKPVAIIDLERSPFREITPSPKQVIVLSDSDNEENETINVQQGICDSSQQVASPERSVNYSMGPKTPPEPQVKFTLSAKAPQVRAIINPLHDPDEIGANDQVDEELSSRMSPGGHIGPNTPPEPPTSPPSSPDAYDPFEPTKSRSPTPDPMDTTVSDGVPQEPRDNIDSRTAIELLEKSINPMPEVTSKSLTPPLADIQPADSQSSIQATPDSNVDKSPERATVQTTLQTSVTAAKPVAQTTPFSSVPTPIITSTPISSNLAPTRINILNSTIIPSTVASSIPQRIVLPNQVKPNPVKISPTKAAIKSTPIKPMLSKTKFTTRKKIQNISDEVILDIDSPYSPGSSDYEDLFEPPSEIVTKPVIKNKSKTPQKHQSTFDSLLGSPVYKVKSKTRHGKKGTTPSKTKTVGVKLDEDNLKILDELPNSAVEMQVKEKFLKKLNRQERVVEEVKLVLKPHYNKKRISKEEYKDILRRSVPKICHNKSGEINPTKIKNLIEAYIRKLRHSKKVTSSSSVNPLKV
nr:serine/arginine repetitive matrix protein 2 isoform X1 [Leptinotarsa decemlineata]